MNGLLLFMLELDGRNWAPVTVCDYIAPDISSSRLATTKYHIARTEVPESRYDRQHRP